MLYKAKYFKKDFDREYLTVIQGISIRGVFALMIVLHHLGMDSQGGILFKGLRHLGLYFTAFFFFLSGYGIIKQYLNSSEYISRFIKKRFTKVMIPYALATISYWVYDLCCGNKYGCIYIVSNIVSGKPIVRNSWYVIAIAVFYVVFYFCARIWRNEKSIIIAMNCFSLIWILFCVVIGYESYFYETSHLLPLGMLYAFNEAKVIRFIKNHYAQFLIGIVSVCMLCVGTVALYNDKIDIIVKEAYYIVTSVLIVEIFIVLFLKLRIRNVFTKFLGKISFELYLFHGLVMSMLHRFLPDINTYIYIIGVLCISILLATLINAIDRRVIRFITIEKN